MHEGVIITKHIRKSIVYYFSVLTIFLIIVIACAEDIQNIDEVDNNIKSTGNVSLIVLGTVQDAGSPHAGCTKDCCADLFESPDKKRMVVSLGLTDKKNRKTYLFEATPDLPRQMKSLNTLAPFMQQETPNGIFLTHAHIGHYTGLMYLGKESMSAKSVPVYTMPKMKSFLENNGPWDQLIALKNIEVQPIDNEVELMLTSSLKVKSITVPHRDEYSETVGYVISGPNKSALFIPDIDKWEKWDKDIIDEIAKVNYAFLDATFFDGEEINNRDISQIPHPFVIESMAKFESLPADQKAKIYFTHLNHTNPLLNPNSEKTKIVLENGFNIARLNQVFDL
ncbi:MAG: MBL fold metallo-hydrolase [Melioribacteraceae bacterium]|nr:MBL fold metallo-hydrolase [Melioribacteraceae bacterium]MCF8264485.1 MBL fold metallo-hydrolase [Melioribacteraceae bacterium]MCF8411928.1 MBL fold metallo-hydrolase [Melioribacteraceae bacterium]MCF8430937.1 MBL fold metallo-hydrolase [Melioribacteraceae bacterium]